VGKRKEYKPFFLLERARAEDAEARVLAAEITLGRMSGMLATAGAEMMARDKKIKSLEQEVDARTKKYKQLKKRCVFFVLTRIYVNF
jgi:hypothetical protein